MPVRVDVLNPDGRDAPVDYRNGVGAPDAKVHPPVNYWAYAAATGGQFHQRHATITDPCDAVIVLLRRRNAAAIRAIQALKKAGHRVFVSWKETGAHQIEQQTRWWWRRSGVSRALELADGAVAATEASVAHYRRLAPPGFAVHFVPPPYPVDVDGWDFSIPVEQRKGILVGTRELDVPTRRHAEALKLAAELARRCGTHVTVMAGAERRRTEALVGNVDLRVIEQRLPYPDYLRMMATHRLVLQLDASAVPGQVAGDALLCRILALGGNGTSERVAFPEFSALNEQPLELLAAAQQLLSEASVYRAAVERSQVRGRAELSFAWARQALACLSATA
jgi:hypothetical protein